MGKVTDEELTSLIIAQQEHTISELVKAEEARVQSLKASMPVKKSPKEPKSPHSKPERSTT